MSLPAERTMPVIRARYVELRHGWLVDLPGGVTLPARDEWEARDLVARHAPGSSIAYVRDALRSGLVDRSTPPGRTEPRAEGITALDRRG